MEVKINILNINNTLLGVGPSVGCMTFYPQLTNCAVSRTTSYRKDLNAIPFVDSPRRKYLSPSGPVLFSVQNDVSWSCGSCRTQGLAMGNVTGTGKCCSGLVY